MRKCAQRCTNKCINAHVFVIGVMPTLLYAESVTLWVRKSNQVDPRAEKHVHINSLYYRSKSPDIDSTGCGTSK